MKVIPRFANHKKQQQVILIELTIVLLIFIASYALSSIFNVSDRFYEWAQQYEKTSDIDELIFALMAFLLALMWFAKQRMDESRKLTLQNYTLLQRLLQVQEAERKSIAQHLHDDLGQYLNAIKAHAASLLIDNASDSDTVFAANKISQSADHAYNATRQMMHHLRPVALDELGLSAAIEQIVDTWKINAKTKLTIKYHVKVMGNIDHLPENTNVAIFRIIQEALTNIAKHAKATSVHIFIQITEEIFSLTIQDDGVGFNVRQKTADSQLQACYGLLGMAERVEAIAGTLEIISTPNQGTLIQVNFNPCSN